MKTLIAVILMMLLANTVQAKVVTQPVEYTQSGKILEGYLAYDDAIAGKRPGVLVVHEWWGLNDYAKMRADQLAQMGYVAFAVDMYGKGIVATTPQEAGKLAGEVRGNRALMRERVAAGLQVLQQQELVDSARVAAIGFCFGGTTVLELAYAGANIAGIVSFHGGITVPDATDSPGIKARVLVLHGADDPSVKPETISAFQEAMRTGGIDWQMMYYGGAVHAFTNPASGNDKSRGAAYDEKAAKRSWQHMQDFFAEIF
jgi:dienelactone hydrolase